MITVLIVDDHPLARFAVKTLIETQRDIQVIGEVGTGEEGILLSKKLSPNIILMDLDMPGIGGFEATLKLLRSCPDAKIIVLTSYETPLFFERLMYAGAAGYLIKKNDSGEIITAIRTAYAGKKYIDQEITQKIALQQKNNAQKLLATLSAREIQILWLVSRGEDVKMIAKKLNLAAKTINAHRYHIFEKLNVKNDVELMHFALQNGLLEKDPQHE